jgi:hypothetical protein
MNAIRAGKGIEGPHQAGGNERGGRFMDFNGVFKGYHCITAYKDSDNQD